MTRNRYLLIISICLLLMPVIAFADPTIRANPDSSLAMVSILCSIPIIVLSIILMISSLFVDSENLRNTHVVFMVVVLILGMMFVVPQYFEYVEKPSITEQTFHGLVELEHDGTVYRRVFIITCTFEGVKRNWNFTRERVWRMDVDYDGEIEYYSHRGKAFRDMPDQVYLKLLVVDDTALYFTPLDAKTYMGDTYPYPFGMRDWFISKGPANENAATGRVGAALDSQLEELGVTVLDSRIPKPIENEFK